MQTYVLYDTFESIYLAQNLASQVQNISSFLLSMQAIAKMPFIISIKSLVFYKLKMHEN